MEGRGRRERGRREGGDYHIEKAKEIFVAGEITQIRHNSWLIQMFVILFNFH